MKITLISNLEASLTEKYKSSALYALLCKSIRYSPNSIQYYREYFGGEYRDTSLIVWNDDSRNYERTKFHFLRQQGKKASGIPNLSLIDFVAPNELGEDQFGGFAVTAGIGIEALIEQYKKELDDYKEIMVKSLADRLAEAFAELMHKKIRTDYWGYAAEEELSYDELIKEKYRGIRPAPGYPAC